MASQWDAWSTLFALLSLWLFTKWWRGTTGWLVYFSSLLAYGLGVFTKESLLTFPAIFACSAWLATPDINRRAWRRLAFALVPFYALVGLNVGIRYATWGNIGGYGTAHTDYATFFWDAFVSYGRLLLSPINSAIFGATIGQVVGALSSIAILVGLVLYGRSQTRLLAIAGVWLIITLIPVLNLPVSSDNLSNNRLLYLSSIGYCIAVATLLYMAITHTTRRWQFIPVSLTGLLVVLSVLTCWIQISPWHVATLQAMEVEKEMIRLVPPVPARAKGMVWYAQNPPGSYKGAYILNQALGMSRRFTHDDTPWIEITPDAPSSPFAGDHRDSFALRFVYDKSNARFHTDYVAGVTWDGSPPTAAEAGTSLMVWDFRGCEDSITGSWQVEQAQSVCKQGEGLALLNTGADAHMTHTLSVPVGAEDARFVRLRVSVLYPSSQSEPYLSQWYWKGVGADWSEEHSLTIPIRQDGKPHVYWTFIPADRAPKGIQALRFDPVNGKVDATVQWIAVDAVK